MPPENYQELWVRLRPEVEELWSSFCFDHAAMGVETLNVTDGVMTQRVFYENSTLEGLSTLPDRFGEAYQLPADSVQLVRVENKPVENWQANWHDFFEPLQIGKHFVVHPPWNPPKDRLRQHPIIIDPGQGFGTGYHLSTALALETLERVVLNFSDQFNTMLDVGIGSGILSIAAARLGIPKIVGVDIEWAAVLESARNSRLNGFEHRIQPLFGSLGSLRGSFDLIIANMLFQELMMVGKNMARLLNQRGWLICSGLLDAQCEEFIRKMKDLGLEVADRYSKAEWNSLTLVHREHSLA